MKKILVVEDDESIHTILEEILKKNGYNIYSAYSGTEALLLLEKEKFDLILLDLMLPGLTGEEILAKVKTIPIIVLSAKVSSDDKVNCLLSGANDYITKPFEARELLARIEVQLRNNSNIVTDNLKYKELELVNDNHTLLICNKKAQIEETKSEFDKDRICYIKAITFKSHPSYSQK